MNTINIYLEQFDELVFGTVLVSGGESSAQVTQLLRVTLPGPPLENKTNI